MSVHFRLVEISEVGNFFLGCFGESYTESHRKLFNPEPIWEKMKEYNIAPVILPVPNWSAYEYGKAEISDETFLNLLLGDEQEYETYGTLFLITDDTLMLKKAIELEAKDLKIFIQVEYKSIFKLHFFNPFDIIFIFRDIASIAQIHHEGYYMPLTALV